MLKFPSEFLRSRIIIIYSNRYFHFFLLFPELYQIWQNLKGAGEYNSEDIVFITMKMCRLLSTDNKCYKNVIIGCIGSLMNNHTAMLFHTLLMNKIG